MLTYITNNNLSVTAEDPNISKCIKMGSKLSTVQTNDGTVVHERQVTV